MCLEVPEEVVTKNEDDDDVEEDEEEPQYGKRPRLSLIPPRSLLHDGKKNKGWTLAHIFLLMSGLTSRSFLLSGLLKILERQFVQLCSYSAAKDYIF